MGYWGGGGKQGSLGGHWGPVVEGSSPTADIGENYIILKTQDNRKECTLLNHNLTQHKEYDAY